MASPDLVLVPGTGASSIDVVDVTTGAGAVKRQVVALGDPTAAGQYLAIDSHNSGQVKLYDAAGNPLLVNPTDAQAGTDLLAVAAMDYNGSTWDRRYNGNDTITLLASAARTVTTVGAVQNTNNWKGVFIGISITNIVTACSLQVALLSGGTTYVFNALPTALTATGSYGYVWYPGALSTNVIVAAANNIQAVYGVPLVGSWTCEIVAGNANAITYSVSAIPIV